MNSAYSLVSSECSLLSSPPPSSNCRAQHAARSPAPHCYCAHRRARWTSGKWRHASAPRESVKQAASQYDGVVKADVGECPVHYHHVGVEDLSAQLQQAEHRTPVKFYKRKGRRKGNLGKLTKGFICFNFTAALNTPPSPGWDFWDANVESGKLCFSHFVSSFYAASRNGNANSTNVQF